MTNRIATMGDQTFEIDDRGGRVPVTWTTTMRRANGEEYQQEFATQERAIGAAQGDEEYGETIVSIVSSDGTESGW